jgi:hypothetical protein
VVLQVAVIIYSSVAMLSFTVHVRPTTTGNLEMLEIFNEGLVLLCAYYIFLFTDYITDPVMRYQFGWGYIGLLGFGLIFNFMNLVISSLSDCKKMFLSIRRWNQMTAEAKKKQALKTLGSLFRKRIEEAKQKHEEQEEEEKPKETKNIFE